VVEKEVDMKWKIILSAFVSSVNFVTLPKLTQPQSQRTKINCFLEKFRFLRKKNLDFRDFCSAEAPPLIFCASILANNSAQIWKRCVLR
jgi:hypothetical protein